MQPLTILIGQYPVVNTPDQQFWDVHFINSLEVWNVILDHEIPQCAEKGPFRPRDVKGGGEPSVEVTVLLPFMDSALRGLPENGSPKGSHQNLSDKWRTCQPHQWIFGCGDAVTVHPEHGPHTFGECSGEPCDDRTAHRQSNEIDRTQNVQVPKQFVQLGYKQLRNMRVFHPV